MPLKIGKFFGNNYVTPVGVNTNAYTPQKSFNFQAYNTNHPKVASDYPPEDFTAGYNYKALNLDFLA